MNQAFEMYSVVGGKRAWLGNMNSFYKLYRDG